jgi:hypothetical protein
MPPVLGFCHVAESGITADVLGRHLTVETERIYEHKKNLSVIHLNKQKGYIKTALAL